MREDTAPGVIWAYEKSLARVSGEIYESVGELGKEMKAVIICTKDCENKARQNQDRFFAPLVCLDSGETIFERQLKLFYECGITNIDIVADSHIEQLGEIAKQPRYEKVKIQFIDVDTAPDYSKVFALQQSAFGFEQETVFCGGGIVFSREYIKEFIFGNSASVVAAKGLLKARKHDLIVRVSQDCIEEVSPEAADEEACFAVWPLMKLQQGASLLNDICVQYEQDGLLEDVCDHLDVERIRKPLAMYRLFEQRILADAYSLWNIVQLIDDNSIKKVLIVTDSWAYAQILKICLDTSGVKQVLFQMTGEPDEAMVGDCVQTLQSEQCDSIISFGSDNALGCGKLTRLFAAAGEMADDIGDSIPLKQYLHIAIPMRFEGGSHAIPEAALIKDGAAKKVAHMGLLPDIVIIEPKFFKDLDDSEKASIVLESIGRLGEALWTAKGSRVFIERIKEKLSEALQSLFGLSGDNINMTLLAVKAWHMSLQANHAYGATAAYALADRLSVACKIPLGQATMICAAQFWLHYADNISNCKDGISRKRVASALFSIKSIFKCNTNYELSEKISFLAAYFGGSKQCSLGDKDIKKAVQQIDNTAQHNTPMEMPQGAMADLLGKSVAGDYLWRKMADAHLDKPFESIDQFNLFWKETRADFTREEIKRVELDILDEAVRICEQNQLSYFLSYETLLAAVRDGNMANRNVQLDISMPRTDWERFIGICEEQLADEYFIHSSKNDPHCWFGHLRICRKNTYIETNIDRFFYSKYRAIYINVHPMYAASKGGGIASRIRHKVVKLIEAVILNKLNPASKKLTRKGKVFLGLVRPFSVGRLHRVDSWLKGKKKGNYGVIGYQYSPGQEAIPLKWLYPLKKGLFEGRAYNIPCDSEAILKRLYGDKYEMAEAIVARTPLCIGFCEPKREISLLSLGGVSKPGKLNTGRNGLLEKLIRKVFGSSARVLDHTKTRIYGAARTMGMRISTNSRQLAALKNKYSGQRCFLIGNGPSMLAEDLDHMVDEYTFGCNLIHKIYDQTKWRPSFLCVSDSGITRTNSRQIIDNLDGSMLLIREFAYRYLHVKPWDAIQLPYISVEGYKVHGNILAYHYISHATVMSMMLEMAFYMGFKEIYLVGVDGTSASKKGSHFTDNYFTQAMKVYGDGVKKKLYKDYDPAKRAAYLQQRSLDIFAQLKEYADKKGIKVYNATRGGYVEVFDRADLDEVLEAGNPD